MTVTKVRLGCATYEEGSSSSADSPESEGGCPGLSELSRDEHSFLFFMSVGSRTSDAPLRRKQKKGSVRRRRETWCVERVVAVGVGHGLSLNFAQGCVGRTARVGCVQCDRR